MSGVVSIWPVSQLYFECDGCKTRWMTRVDPPLMSVQDFNAFTKDPNRMESCPRDCGSRTCSIAFRISNPNAPPPPSDSPKADPFSMFDLKKEK